MVAKYHNWFCEFRCYVFIIETSNKFFTLINNWVIPMQLIIILAKFFVPACNILHNFCEFHFLLHITTVLATRSTMLDARYRSEQFVPSSPQGFRTPHLRTPPLYTD